LTHSGGFTRFGKQVETLELDHEPNLDRAGQTGPAPDPGQIKDLLVRNTLELGTPHRGICSIGNCNIVDIFGTI
jgi:hypothetical protein